jgi:hypothetical protein
MSLESCYAHFSKLDSQSQIVSICARNHLSFGDLGQAMMPNPILAEKFS